jgi:hypothetical protein
VGLRVARARRAWLAIVQTAVAAGVSWWLARLIVGTPAPFFAPAAAVIALGLARGQPLRRSSELVIGVAIGIAMALALRSVIGVGPVQIGAIVALTIVAALLVGAGTVLVNQAAISAVLVMTLPGAGQGAGPDRFFDALIGGAVALVISQLVFVRNPTSVLSDLDRDRCARDSARPPYQRDHRPDPGDGRGSAARERPRRGRGARGDPRSAGRGDVSTRRALLALGACAHAAAVLGR